LALTTTSALQVTSPGEKVVCCLQYCKKWKAGWGLGMCCKWWKAGWGLLLALNLETWS